MSSSVKKELGPSAPKSSEISPASEIKFGTDGWRAVISDTFTFKNVKIVSQAISDWVARSAGTSRKNRVVVGYDTRFMSGDYAALVAGTLAANGISVILADSPVPTPALSYAVPQNKAVCGIMITASHNPYRFNGIKIKTAQGGGAGRDITDQVEALLGRTPVQFMSLDEGLTAKKIVRQDLKPAYLAFLRSYLDLPRMKAARYKVLTDAMHGSGNGLMAEVIRGTALRLTLMRDDINPYFEGTKPEPVQEFLGEIIQRVKKEKFDIGLVLDGDADRIAAVAPGGEFVHPQKILGLLILHLVRNRGRQGGVVKTICGTTLIDKIADKLGLPLYETPVGFKYISDLMVGENIVAGGEEAGGMGFQDYIPERDGTLAGLLLVEMMAYQKKNLKALVSEMEKEFGRYVYERRDVKLGKKPFDLDRFRQTKKLLGKKVVDVKDFDGVKLICEDESWLMLRPSGTEPLVRAYAEAKSADRARQLIRYGEKLLGVRSR